ncbi:MAG: anaerobic ribonucleoside-triphosphate reductase activating protein [Bacilli bacterium]|nr:anaerobic ribonucleoside-triphosphate reductase activating protein [Bacilli bacterium]
MEIRLASPIQYDSIVDGEGIRAVLWTQGCPHKCPGCHNPITHDFDGGFIADVEELKNELTNNMKYQDGITLSGGDPFMQISAVLEIAKHVKALGKNVWAYTGFTFEKLIEISEKHPNMLELLNNVDVLVDGKFIESEKSYDLYYKGSRNQRIIDVAKSLENKEVVLVSKYAKEKTYNKLAEKKDYIFV